MQKRRYQIFLSSTFSDLEEERKKVMHAMLGMDCIPSGMEYFPASDEETFAFIKTIIDESDYYVLILAGRYGSVASDGISYTEKEYDYAISAGKPVLSFLLKDVSQLTLSKIDSNTSLVSKMEAFRNKVLSSGRIAKFWNNGDQLAAEVVLTLTHAIKRYPQPGWVRGDQLASNELLQEVNDLLRQNEELNRQISENQPTIPVSELAPLTDSYVVNYRRRSSSRLGSEIQDASTQMTWQEISLAVLQDLSKSQTMDALELRLRRHLRESHGITASSIHASSMRQIVVQLELLGLISSKVSPSTQGGKKEFFSRTAAGKMLVFRELAVVSEASAQ